MNFYPDHLISIRESKGLTQEELAKIIGQSKQSIGQYERGENQPRAKTVYKLARALNCSVYDISDLKPLPDDPALVEVPQHNPGSFQESDSPGYHPDPLLGLIIQSIQHYDKHQKADLVKLIGLWEEMDNSQHVHCLHCMEGLVRSSQGSANSA